MAEETLSVGPFTLDRKDWKALCRVTGAVGFLDLLFSVVLVGLASLAFIFSGYGLSRLLLTRFMSADAFDEIRIVPIAAAGLLFLLYVCAMSARSTRRAARAQRLDQPRVISISPAGLEARAGGIHSTYLWSAFERIVTTRSHVVFMLSPYVGVIIPARAFASKDAFAAFGEKARAWHAAAGAPRADAPA